MRFLLGLAFFVLLIVLTWGLLGPVMARVAAAILLLWAVLFLASQPKKQVPL